MQQITPALLQYEFADLLGSMGKEKTAAVMARWKYQTAYDIGDDVLRISVELDGKKAQADIPVSLLSGPFDHISREYIRPAVETLKRD